MSQVFGKPTVTQIDMGLHKPFKYRYWCPWPVWYRGHTAMHTSRALYPTVQSALQALLKYLEKAEKGA